MPLFPAADTEIEPLADLVNAAYRGQGGAYGWTHEADYIDGARITPEALRADLAAHPEAALLVWRGGEGAEITGCVRLAPAGGDAWVLGLLSVRPGLQDRGLGRAILQASEAWALARGARRMRMKVVNVRDSLIAWYLRRGYAPTGGVEPFPYGDDRFGRPGRDDLGFVVLEKALLREGWEAS